MTDIAAAYRKIAAELLKDPDNAEQLASQYTILSSGPRNPAQLAIARRCAAVAPNEFIAVFNYASALSRNGENAIGTFRRALEIAPPDQRGTTLHHIGLAYHDQGEYETALSYYEMARKIADSRLLGQSIAIAKLACGRLQEGLYEFEVKHHLKPRKAISDSGIPWWNGEDLTGKTVILTHEQGFGDTLQFIRFAPRLKEWCKTLIFSGSEPIAPLIAEQFDCFDDVINEVGPFKADFVTSPMAAAALMGLEYEDVSGEPYMKVEPLKLPARGKLKVGLSWKGSPGYQNDALRSASLKDFCPLFDLPGAAFYSLQVRPGPAEISELGLDGFIADMGSHFTDWRDTAAAIAAMDVIVATDSANAHMAGALGVPVMLLLGKNPCWRWMRGDTTPWYDKTKIFRQEKVDEWPMRQVRSELQRLVSTVHSATLASPKASSPASGILPKYRSALMTGAANGSWH
jgi:tetratricopeptide (TPR) repeat protein